MKKLNVRFSRVVVTIVAMVGMGPRTVQAQAPKISYPKSSYSLPIGSAVASISPRNTGGAVSNGLVSTYAGVGPSNNGPTTVASFNFPNGVAVDAFGNLYVADQQNNVIRKISASGVVSNFAGTTISGSDDGFKEKASFNLPSGVAVDTAGNVYVADQGNNKIRKISALGVVTTLAGDGSKGSMNGNAATATFNQPSGVAVDTKGIVYVADLNNNKIRKITLDGIVSTLAGTGIAGNTNGAGNVASFEEPFGIAVDANSNVYVTDQQNYRVRKITPQGIVSTFAGSIKGDADGIGTAARFFRPSGITVDTGGNVYVSDVVNLKIRRITPSGVVTTLCGSGNNGSLDGAANVASFKEPSGLAFDAKTGRIYIADISNNSIRATLVANGAVITIAGIQAKGANDGPWNSATFSFPKDMVADDAGNVYVADAGNNRIRKISTAGVVTTFATGLSSPTGLAIDKAGNLYVSAEGTNSVYKVSASGGVGLLAGGGGSGPNGSGADEGVGAAASFDTPCGLAVDAQGNVYVADKKNHKIRKITPSGEVSSFAGSGLNGSNNGVGNAASFYRPTGVAIDTAGNLFVADQSNNLIRKINKSGTVTTIAGDGTMGANDGSALAASFYQPYGISVDVTGNVYVGDLFNNKFRKLGTSDIVSTVAGGGGTGFYGGGSGNGVGLFAGFKNPSGTVILPTGVVYIADNGNHLVRKVTLGYTISPQLPKGLSFDYTTGSITGTPTELSPLTNYTITGINEFGSYATVVSIAIVFPLPVTLSTFEANVRKNAIEAQWKTATETNTSHFIVQRSTDGNVFEEIGTVKAEGAGANAYRLLDSKPKKGINYYRLRIVDKEGGISYSRVVSVPFFPLNVGLSIFPNPAKDFAIVRFGESLENASISVYDNLGRRVILQTMKTSAQTFQINTQHLKNGVYVLKLKTSEGSVQERLLIQK